MVSTSSLASTVVRGNRLGHRFNSGRLHDASAIQPKSIKCKGVATMQIRERWALGTIEGYCFMCGQHSDIVGKLDARSCLCTKCYASWLAKQATTHVLAA